LSCTPTPGRLHLSVTGGPAGPVSLDTETPDNLAAAALPAETGATVTAGPVNGWCELIEKVGWAAGRDPALPTLAVVRLVREPGAVLRVEATDSYRTHRAGWAEPTDIAVDTLMPADAVGRAVRLLTGGDPTGQLTVHVDAEHIHWRTGRVRITARAQPGTYPDLEAAREQVLADADVTFTVDRAATLAALTTAGRLAAATGDGRVGIHPRVADHTAEVTVDGRGPVPAWRTVVRLGEATGPVHPLQFNPRYARQAFAFLDGPTVSVAAATGRRAVHLQSGHRHALVMQLRPTAAGQAA